MSVPFPGWVLDPARNQYYYHSAEENCYVYQSGERIYVHGTLGSAPSARLPSESGPRTIPPVSNAAELTESFSYMGLSDNEYLQAGPSSGKLHSQQQCLNISLLLLIKHQIQRHLAIVQNP
jgi:hypothetical protein